MEKLFEKFSPIMNKLGNSRTLQGISGGMMGSIVVTIVGSLCLLFAVFPVQAVQKFIASIGISQVLLAVNTYTIGCIALYIVVLVTNSLVKQYKPDEDGIVPAIIALMNFLIVTPIGTTADKVSAIPSNWLGASGVFSALIIAIITAKLFVFIREKGWTIKMPDSVPPMVARSLEALIPGMLVGIIFIVISAIFTKTSFGSVHQFIYTILQKPLSGLGGSLPAMCIFTIVAQLLWFFGIHGTNVICPIYTTLWLPLDLANQAAVAQSGVGAGKNIIGLAFFNTYTFGGCVLGLVILMAFRAKSTHYKSIGRLALVPALFGITEPVIFGTPLVLNFTFFIPFVFGNVIAILVAYAAFALHLVPTLIGTQTIFGLPVGVHAAIQGSWQAVVLQIVVLIIVGVVWYPFFKKADHDAYQQELESEGGNTK